MIYEYAISPQLMTDLRDMNFFRSSLGSEYGRLVSDIPRKKWARLARRAILESDNRDVAKKKLAASLDQLSRHAVYRRNTAPEVFSEVWLNHALAAHADRPFRAILTDSYDGDEICVLANDADYPEDPLWMASIDNLTDRAAQQMIETIRPMLNCANEIALIDRNFNPEKYRWRPFVEELAMFLSNRTFSPAINKITFHVGDRITSNHIELLCRTHIARNLPASMRIDFHIWPWDELHDRYVLTDLGGVKFGIGLDIHDGSGPTQVEINRISAETHKRWWVRCKQHSPSFTISK